MLSAGPGIADFHDEVFADLGLKIQTVTLENRRPDILIKVEQTLQHSWIQR